MPFKRLDSPLADVLHLEPKVYGDERGFFFESYNSRDLADLGVPAEWVQDNHSKSAAGVLRGLHYQKGAHAQDKLVRVVVGRVFDVVVDIRRSSPTFGRWAAFELSAANKRLLYVPKGFAHGFLALEEGTEFLYKCSTFYHPPSESGIAWNDPALAIPWPLPGGRPPQLSGRDGAWPNLADKPEEELFP